MWCLRGRCVRSDSIDGFDNFGLFRCAHKPARRLEGQGRPARRSTTAPMSVILALGPLRPRDQDPAVGTCSSREWLMCAASRVVSHLQKHHPALPIGLCRLGRTKPVKVISDLTFNHKAILNMLDTPSLGSGGGVDPGAPTPTWATYGKQAPAPKPKPQRVWLTEGAPPWLPAGWKWCKSKRTYGASAGSYDKYFLAPNGRMIRTKQEVLKFDPNKPPGPGSRTTSTSSTGRGGGGGASAAVVRPEDWDAGWDDAGQDGRRTVSASEMLRMFKKMTEQQKFAGKTGTFILFTDMQPRHILTPGLGRCVAHGLRVTCLFATSASSAEPAVSRRHFGMCGPHFPLVVQPDQHPSRRLAGADDLCSAIFPSPDSYTLSFGHLDIPINLTPDPFACASSDSKASVQRRFSVIGFAPDTSVTCPPVLSAHVVTSPASGHFFANYPSHATPEKARADYLYSVLTESLRSSGNVAIVETAPGAYGALRIARDDRKTRIVLLLFPPRGDAHPLPWWPGAAHHIAARSLPPPLPPDGSKDQTPQSSPCPSPEPRSSSSEKRAGPPRTRDGRALKRARSAMPPEPPLSLGAAASVLARVRSRVTADTKDDPVVQGLLCRDCAWVVRAAEVFEYPALRESALEALETAISAGKDAKGAVDAAELMKAVGILKREA